MARAAYAVVRRARVAGSAEAFADFAKQRAPLLVLSIAAPVDEVCGVYAAETHRGLHLTYLHR